jgi:hypothetical protein
MLRIITILFGVIFIFAGSAGYLPSLTKDGLLLGLFAVDSMHNLVHIVSGVVAIMAATSYGLTVLYLRIFGLLYTAVGLWGFYTNGDLYFMQVNMPDNILHIVLGVVIAYLGFSASRKER